MSAKPLDHAPVRLPPPFVLFGHLAAALLLGWRVRLPLPLPFAVRLLGVAFVGLGLVLAFAAIRAMSAARTPVDPFEPVSAIVTAGPYRFTRNPIYLGFVAALVGLPLALGSYWGLILAPVMLVLMYVLVIRHEEAYLEQKFGPAYLAYKQRVRRWL
jgi:protein-S-isoprenylcysteine O-methyltransferase Ste14